MKRSDKKKSSLNIAQKFNQQALDYDNWFNRHPDIFQAEVNALLNVISKIGNSLEIGVGTGRFASALGIRYGIDPALDMLLLAKSKGINTTIGYAEKLPYPNDQFDSVFMITSLCFTQNPDLALQEAYRVLKDDGTLVIAYIPRNSQLGRKYKKNKDVNSLYRFAKFLTFSELSKKLKIVGFKIECSRQTLLNSQLRLDIESGHSRGSFVVVSCKKYISN